MENKDRVSASEPSRLVAQSPPSILVVEPDPDLQEFLRVSLQRWYQIAGVPDGVEAAEHLEHCPPRGLIVGQLTASGEETLVSALQELDDSPPVLKMWSVAPPAGWADESLRHPFLRVDLLRAVDRLMHAERPEEPSERDLELEAEIQRLESRTENEGGV